MRVLPHRHSSRRSSTLRGNRNVPAPAPVRPPAPEATEPAPIVDQHLLAERRHRASVVPNDAALYACSCGYQFEAAVSTSVACPHCGTGQAW